MSSGTFAADKPRTSEDAVAKAYRLACEIEELLAARDDDAHVYGKRLARALAQSLIDQLADLTRGERAKKVG